MSGILREMALGLCAVSLISAAAQAAAGKGRQTAAVRLIEAMAAALVLLAPLGKAAPQLPDLQAQTQDALSAVQESADRMTARQVERYIEDEAAARGISCTAQAECEAADGVFYLRSLRLRFAQSVSEEERQAFRQEMAQAFRLEPDEIGEA